MKSALPWKGNGTVKSFNGLQTRVRIKNVFLQKLIDTAITNQISRQIVAARLCYARIHTLLSFWIHEVLWIAGELFLIYAFSNFQLPYLLLERKLDIFPNALIYLHLPCFWLPFALFFFTQTEPNFETTHLLLAFVKRGCWGGNPETGTTQL